MKSARRFLSLLAVAAVGLVAIATSALAEEFKVNVEKKTEISRTTTEEAPGAGDPWAPKYTLKRMERNNFDAAISYSGLEAAKDISLKFYIIGTCSISGERDKKLLLAGKYEHPAQAFNAGEKKNFTIGPIGFPDWEVKKDGGHVYRCGLKYEGWVVEFYRDGKLLSRTARTPDLEKKLAKGEILENYPGFEKPKSKEEVKCVETTTASK
ncbi:hypothetical protein DB346_17145 [Verrucomicrobia bacterium LW23]|nr:hypothetical protein DB346_17145 [Verrucomicrobia bacterium LW23]